MGVKAGLGERAGGGQRGGVSRAAPDPGRAHPFLTAWQFMAAKHTPPHQRGTCGCQSARPWEGLALHGGLKPLIPCGWIKPRRVRIYGAPCFMSA